MVRRDLKTFAKDPATRDHREPSRNLGACGKESARYYAKVFKRLSSKYDQLSS
jgi:hypothetical protein